jgi:hypothetical protein
MNITPPFIICLIVALLPSIGLAQNPVGHANLTRAPAVVTSPQAAAETITAGSTITMQNWQNYRHFMPDGIIALFQGQDYWKMPADVEISVGPTIVHPLPRSYLEATERYSSQSKVVELPGGGLSLQGYRGGKPFPNPQEPHKGWKILVNLWYRYLPNLLVDTYGTGCTQDSFGSINCSADEIVYRQLSFNTDPSVPARVPGAEGKFYTEWVMIVEPEQQRYNATLTISYADLTRPEEVYAFVPSLRRYRPVSAAARCAPSEGMDATADDYRFGFDSNLTQVQVQYAGNRRILALIDASLPQTRFPDGYDMPLGWPKPSWGKWQLRDTDVISVSKLPSQSGGYCYGKRVMYVDQAFAAPLWEDLYDMEMKPWKFLGLFLRTLDVPGIGPVNATGSQVEAYWDIQNKHSTFFSDPAMNRPFYVNEQAPREYNNVTKYTSPGGLNEIMR